MAMVVDAEAAMAIPEDQIAATHTFIENALQLMLQGNAAPYQRLVQQLTQDSNTLVYLALPRCISTIARDPQAYQQLVDALFKFDFLREPAECRAYTQFLVHLVSSNTVYVLPTLQMLARSLCRPQRLPPALEAAAKKVAAMASVAATTKAVIGIGSSFRAAVEPPAAPVAVVPTIDVEERIRMRYRAAHETFQRVLALVPTAANILFPVLCEHFPHKRLAPEFQVAYVTNLLELSRTVPGLQERIFGLIIDQFVAVDVEIKLDEAEEDIFTMDDFLDDDLLPPDASQVDEMADKLDQMMLVMFEFIQGLVGTTASVGGPQSDANENGEADQRLETAAKIFKILIKVFEHSILNTHRSKYPQFLLFYICQMDPQFQDIFISQLLAVSLNAQTPAVTRHSCGAYLASFVARAKYISVSYIQKALYHLMKWMHDQLDLLDEQSASIHAADGEDPTIALQRAEQELEVATTRGYFQETIFISTLQTVCYMVCFRGLEIAQAENGYEFLQSLGWERVLVISSYCPLAFIQQTVATEFLNFVETLRLISDDCIEQVDHLINTSSVMGSKSRSKTMERSAPPQVETTTNGITRSSSSVVPLTTFRQPLETFFPFDPYLLRRSFKFIGPLYLYWKHADPTSSENCGAMNAVKKLMEEAEHEEDEDDEDEESVDEDASMSGSVQTTGSGWKMAGSYNDGYSMSVGSSDEEELSADAKHRQLSHRKRPRVPLNLGVSPALSASSPPSRLPPLGTVDAFSIGFHDDQDEEDEGF